LLLAPAGWIWIKLPHDGLEREFSPLPEVGLSESKGDQLKKTQPVADLGTVHRSLLRAIDTDVTLARRRDNRSVFNGRDSLGEKKAANQQKL